MFDFLGKFGTVVTKRVLYSVHSSGPLEGMRNGDRQYKVEINPLHAPNLGSYHIIDGQKVNLRYPGQPQT